MTKRISLFAASGVQALDVTGPASVFSAANAGITRHPAYKVEVISPDGGLIETVSGVTIHSVSIAELSPKGIDTLLVAGHSRPGTEALIDNSDAQAWVMEATRFTRRWGSVCSGAFALAAWGLLSNRSAATHWSAADKLSELFPDIEVDPDSLYVTDGNVWTSAGVTAGIDMSLAMVEADYGASLAAEIARHLVVYFRRPGTQSQFSRPLEIQSDSASPYRELIDWIETNLSEDLSAQTLASKAGQSLRTFQRRFVKEIGRTPAAYVEDVKMERAKALIACDTPLKTVAKEIGYPSAAQLTSTFRRRLGVAPSVWKAMHCNTGT